MDFEGATAAKLASRSAWNRHFCDVRDSKHTDILVLGLGNAFRLVLGVVYDSCLRHVVRGDLGVVTACWQGWSRRDSIAAMVCADCVSFLQECCTPNSRGLEHTVVLRESRVRRTRPLTACNLETWVVRHLSCDECGQLPDGTVQLKLGFPDWYGCDAAQLQFNATASTTPHPSGPDCNLTGGWFLTWDLD